MAGGQFELHISFADPDRLATRAAAKDAERLVEAWNARRAAHMPALFSPTIGAALAARYWYLWVRCPACRMTSGIDLRTLDRQPTPR